MASTNTIPRQAATREAARGELLAILQCPLCAAIGLDEDVPAQKLVCRVCSATVPVRAGIPRCVDVPSAELARRTQESFGYEWTQFTDWRDSGERNFLEYFRDLDRAAVAGGRVLDAGCGMGRHARQMADLARLVVAVDFSAAIETAARNASDCTNVQCVQGDITRLPFADGTFDYVYSIGVLHHIENTAAALAALARKARAGGRVRVYLYWKRHGWSGVVLSIVSAVRRITTHLPFAVLKAACRLLSAALYVGVVLPYRALDYAGAQRHRRWPLYLYARYPFAVLYNDQFDRFSAPLEQRFDQDEIRVIMEAAGLRDVRVYSHFGWIAEGMR